MVSLPFLHVDAASAPYQNLESVKQEMAAIQAQMERHHANLVHLELVKKHCLGEHKSVPADVKLAFDAELSSIRHLEDRRSDKAHFWVDHVAPTYLSRGVIPSAGSLISHAEENGPALPPSHEAVALGEAHGYFHH